MARRAPQQVYTDFFEEHNQPETKMDEAVRIFKVRLGAQSSSTRTTFVTLY